MLKWLENYYKRNDEKFLRVIQDSDNAEKYLSELYGHRIVISILLLVFFVISILLTFTFSPRDDLGIILGALALMLMNYMTIDSQIKMIQMIKFIKSTIKTEEETRYEQVPKA